MGPRSAMVISALVALVALVAVGCGDDKSAPPRAAAVDGAATARQLIAAGALVIDVRERDEWDDGHLPTARHVPLAEVGARVAEIEQAAGAKDRPIVVYCGAGGRAAKAKAELEAAGFTRVTNGGGYRTLAAP